MGQSASGILLFSSSLILISIFLLSVERIMMKIAGTNGNKSKKIDHIVERCYQTHFAGKQDFPCTPSYFYRAVCETVEEINKKLGSTQLNVPKSTTLQLAYEKHHKDRDTDTEDKLTKEEFQEILQEVIVESGLTAGIGLKDILMYIFGIPATALMMKERFGPKTIPNDLFIPAVTSATVFLLAKLHKI